MVLEYTIESGANKKDLIRIVSKMIKNDWTPSGGICIDIHDDENRFVQAMIRNRA